MDTLSVQNKPIEEKALFRSLPLIDTLPYGRFLDQPASFEILTPHLPADWNYIYQNRKMLLRVDQFGLSYAQAFPPEDIVMLARDRFQRSSPWLFWINSPSFKKGPYTNFFRPNLRQDDPSYLPERYSVKFTPSRAIYSFSNEGVATQTEVFLHPDKPTICQRLRLRNSSDQPIDLTLHAIAHHACRWGSMAAWDKPEWYTETNFSHRKSEGLASFTIQVRSPICDRSKRRAALFEAEDHGLASSSVSYERFIGSGTYDRPDAIFNESLDIPVNESKSSHKSRLFAYPQSCNLQYKKTLQPGEEWALSQSLSWIDISETGMLPPINESGKHRVPTGNQPFDRYLSQLSEQHSRAFSKRKLSTPDPALNQYANEWLPLQVDWACSLDRGWPTGMRGGRDAANDFTALVPFDPEYVRRLILAELSCQEADGRIPRHFSAKGHAGPERDRRPTVDAGAVLIELIHAYLVRTLDFDILKERIPWLDAPADKTSSLFDHVIRIADYYLDSENIGEHGLVKIREGGWMDAINHAGQRGRGECVTTTFQVVHALHLLIEILGELKTRRLTYRALLELRLKDFHESIQTFTENARRHALNSSGYFNGIFNDDGLWFFTDKDPDGEKRIFAPATYWAIIAQALNAKETQRALLILEDLKCSAGYHLQWPGFEKETYPNIGRMASGDSPSGRAEHANPYNHGSHGFLGRALSIAGKGDLLYDVLKALLPYDQEKHPVAQAMTPPYAMVNVWERIPGFPFRGKDSFLTGSTAYGIRMIYDWLIGIKPSFEGLNIDPCLPSLFDALDAEFEWLGHRINLSIENPDRVSTGIRELRVNGKLSSERSVDLESARPCAIVKADDLDADKSNRVQVTLGK